MTTSSERRGIISIILVNMFAYGIILNFIFLGPYNELQKFKTDYIPAICEKGPNYYPLYLIRSLSELDLGKFKYASATNQRIYQVSMYNINTYILNKTTDEYQFAYNTYIRTPSTSYQVIYTTNKISRDSYIFSLTGKFNCFIPNNFKGPAILDINYEIPITRTFLAAHILIAIPLSILVIYIILIIINTIYNYSTKKFTDNYLKSSKKIIINTQVPSSNLIYNNKLHTVDISV